VRGRCSHNNNKGRNQSKELDLQLIISSLRLVEEASNIMKVTIASVNAVLGYHEQDLKDLDKRLGAPRKNAVLAGGFDAVTHAFKAAKGVTEVRAGLSCYKQMLDFDSPKVMKMARDSGVHKTVLAVVLQSDTFENDTDGNEEYYTTIVDKIRRMGYELLAKFCRYAVTNLFLEYPFAEDLGQEGFVQVLVDQLQLYPVKTTNHAVILGVFDSLGGNTTLKPYTYVDGTSRVEEVLLGFVNRKPAASAYETYCIITCLTKVLAACFESDVHEMELECRTRIHFYVLDVLQRDLEGTYTTKSVMGTETNIIIGCKLMLQFIDSDWEEFASDLVEEGALDYLVTVQHQFPCLPYNHAIDTIANRILQTLQGCRYETYNYDEMIADARRSNPLNG